MCVLALAYHGFIVLAWEVLLLLVKLIALNVVITVIFVILFCPYFA